MQHYVLIRAAASERRFYVIFPDAGLAQEFCLFVEDIDGLTAEYNEGLLPDPVTATEIGFSECSPLFGFPRTF